MSKEQILSALLKEIRINYQLLRKGVEFVHGAESIPHSLRAVIEVLFEEKEITVPHLAKLRFTSRQGIQVMVDDMITRGWAEQKPNPFHKKSPLIVLTAQGLQSFERLKEEELKHMRNIQINLPEEKLQEALHTLNSLNTSILEFISRR